MDMKPEKELPDIRGAAARGRWKDSVLFSLLLAAVFRLCVWKLHPEGDNPFMYFRF